MLVVTMFVCVSVAFYSVSFLLVVKIDCIFYVFSCFFFFQAEDGIRDLVRSRGLGDVYKRQQIFHCQSRAIIVSHYFLLIGTDSDC